MLDCVTSSVIRNCVNLRSCNGFNYGIWCDNHVSFTSLLWRCVEVTRYVLTVLIRLFAMVAKWTIKVVPCQSVTIYLTQFYDTPVQFHLLCGDYIMTVFNLIHHVIKSLCDDCLDQTNCTDYIIALSSDIKNKVYSTVGKTDTRLQWVIHAMIIRDFLCWIPFTCVCWLHL